jgi:hypothetical protein
MYPEIIEDKKYRYRYTAPLPTAELDNFYHILSYITAKFLKSVNSSIAFCVSIILIFFMLYFYGIRIAN